MPSTKDILAVILGGGRGTRLYPLTKMRAKPAVPIAGKYRLIDIPISNCINSNIYRIAVLTQFNSVSLNRHIARTYQFDSFHSGWVQIWAAEQTTQSMDWYQGTADAVRKQIFEIRSTRAKYVLILSGDHLYRMDYATMANYHWKTDADLTIAVKPVESKDVSRFGILKQDKTQRITSFAEKPKDPVLLSKMVSRDDPDYPYLGSMGIYLFKTQVLLDLLENKEQYDFGKQIIPYAIDKTKVYGFNFDGYWEDIGTIRSFYETNLLLAKQDSPFNFFNPKTPIYTHPRSLPGTIVENSTLANVLLAEGVRIQNAEIHNSVIGLRSQIHSGVKIANSVLMGSDYYDRPLSDNHDIKIPIGIGSDSQINGAIIDKNACIGSNVIIRPFPRGTDLDTHNWVVRDGIVVLPKNTALSAGTIIGPDE